MAITYKAVLASKGTSLIIQISTTSESLYGQTITISKSGSTVGTTTFDNTGNAEYTVDEAGTYTVSVTYSGVTFSNTVEVTDTFDTEIYATPDGSTVTPVNDIQIWLHCGNVWDKNYTTISQVLADTTTLLTLINSNNAVDYMVRSHDWCDDVCADATAMTYIGANNYAADTLLADDNSGFVPTMTDNTTPSGECIASSSYSTARYPYKAFDKNVTSYHNSTNNGAISAYYLGYTFPTAKTVKAATILANSYGANYYYDVALYAGNSLSNLTKISDTVRIQGADGTETTKAFTVTNNIAYTTYVIKIEDSNASSTNGSSFCLQTYEMQFYAKDGSWLESICNSQYFESVLNVKVPTMTSNTTPSGEAFANASYTAAQYYPWKAFNSGETKGWMADNTNPYIHANNYIGYAFTSAVKIYMSAVTLLYYSEAGQITGKFQASSDGGTDYKDITDIAIATLNSANTPTKVITNQNLDAYSRYRYICTTQPNSANHYGLRIQFYGRS